MDYDSRADTLDHILKVQFYIGEVIKELLERSQNHDASKLEPPEKETFDRMTPRLSSVTYGSDEYRNMLKEMKPAIDHHNRLNSHHPEHYIYGIEDHRRGHSCMESMNLIDIIEMFCDWKAATLRHNDGDIKKSLKINVDRFSITPQLFSIFENTLDELGW